MTNFEKIKQMTVDEIAKLLNDLTFFCRYDECDKCPMHNKKDNCCDDITIKNWLNCEVEAEN